MLEKDLEEQFQKYHGYFLSDKFFESTKHLIYKTRGFNLANFNEFAVFKSIITDEIKKVKISDLLDQVQDCVLELLNEYIQEAFVNYPELLRVIEQEIKHLANEKHDKAETLINEFLSMEKTVVYTINPYYMDMIDKIKESRKQMKEKHDKREIKSMSDFSLVSLEVKSPKESEKIDDEIEKFVRSHYDKEMSVINIQISCFSYWKVFEKRFVDYFHMTVISKLLYDFRDLSS